MSIRDWERYGDTNVGIGMAPSKPTYEERELARLRRDLAAKEAENAALRECMAHADAMEKCLLSDVVPEQLAYRAWRKDHE